MIGVAHPHSGQSLLLQLPRALLARIASFLPPGEAAYGLRTVCHAFARELPVYAPELLRITVSKKRPPVSSVALVSRWGATGSCRGLTYKQRFQLLLDAARGGSAKAVAQLSRSTGCLLNEKVFRAAAHAGNEEVCEWLLGQDIELQDRGAWVLAVAAEAGHTALCKKLYDAGLRLDTCALNLALRAGRPAVFNWMCEQGPIHEASPVQLRAADMPDGLPADLWGNAAYGGQLELMQELKGCSKAEAEDLPAVAHGCPLPVLRELVEECSSYRHPRVGFTARQAADIMAAAAASPTPDWQDKVLWLLQTGTCSPINGFGKGTAAAFAALPDAEQRLEWLAGQGFELQDCRELMHAAVEAGRGELVLQLWFNAKEGQRETGEALVWTGLQAVAQAVVRWGLGLARQLQCQGMPVDAYEVVYHAIYAGRLDALQWAVQLAREEMAREAAAAAGVAVGGGQQQQQEQQQQQAHGRAEAAGDVQIMDAGQQAKDQAPLPLTDAAQEAQVLEEFLIQFQMEPACESGSLELVQWMHARGVPLGSGIVGHAVDSGNEALVEWMVEQGVDVEEVG